jgi:hypothetical protein
MAWTPEQQRRLAIEKAILDERMPLFEFVNPAGETTVEGNWQSSQSTHYRFLIRLPKGFPDECPSCYVVWPSPLRGRDQLIEAYGSNHAMHTWETDRPGWTKICTFHPNRWHSQYTLEKVIHKAMLWIEAYEAHMETGRPIADFLREAR